MSYTLKLFALAVFLFGSCTGRNVPVAAYVDVPSQDLISGAVTVLSAGAYTISHTQTLTGYGIRVQGAGEITVLTWTGNSTDPMFEVDSCFHCSVENLKITVGAGKTLAYGIKQTQLATGAPSENNSYLGLDIEGAALPIWVTQAGGIDANNNSTQIRNLFADGYTKACVEFDGANDFNNLVDTPYCIGNGTSSYGVAFMKGGASNSASGVILNATLNNNAYDIYSDGISVEPVSVKNLFSQGSQHFIDNESTTGSPCIYDIQDVHWASDAMKSGNQVMRFTCSGPISISDSRIGTDYAKSMTVGWYPTYDWSPLTFSVIDILFLNSNGGNLWSGKPPTYIRGVYVQTSDKANTDAGTVGAR